MRALLRRLLLPAGTGFLAGGVLLAGYRALRGQAPWTQILFPLLLTFELLRLQGGAQSKVATALAVIVAECALIAIAIALALRHKTDQAFPLERRLAAMIALFLPGAVARLAAAEVVTLSMGLLWFLPNPRVAPAGFSYTEKTAIRYLPWIVLVGSIPEIALFEVLLAHRPLWLKVASLAFAIWGFLWVCGITMLMRGETAHNPRDADYTAPRPGHVRLPPVGYRPGSRGARFRRETSARERQDRELRGRRSRCTLYPAAAAREDAHHLRHRAHF